MERRNFDRAPLAFPIRLRINDIGKFTEKFTSDLSAGGIFLEMNSPMPEGTKVEIAFYLEAVKKEILTKGKVVRSVPDGDEDAPPAGMAIQFEALDKDGKRFIELLVDKYKREHPEKFPDQTSQEARDIPEAADPGPLAEGAEEQPSDKIDLQVLVRFPEEESFQEAQAHTLGEGEVFVRCDKLRPAGTRAFLQIHDPGEDKWIPAEAMVIRAMYTAGTATVQSGPGVAVVFQDVGQELQRLIHAG